MGKIAIVGSINMDMTVTAERIPQKGETLYGKNLRYVPGGKGANQAVAAAKLGADVTMFGCVGDDAAGNEMMENLGQCGVDTHCIRTVHGVPTGIAIITVGEGDNTIIVVPGANDYVSKEYIDSVREELVSSDIVMLQQEIPGETVEYVLGICAENKVRTILNPAPARPISPEAIEKVDFITPNEHEAAILFGDKSVEDILRKYPHKLIITQGAQGVSVCGKDGKILRVPARKANVIDTTGAGDTLNGAFAVKIMERKPLEEALMFGNVAASLSTERFGAQGGMPALDEVEDELRKLKTEQRG